MATQEIEPSAKLKEGDILISDLERRLEAVTVERNELNERVRDLDGHQQDYDQKKADLQASKRSTDFFRNLRK